MNRRIFSLVCIALYALLDVSIYCSQQKESGARNKSVRGTKEINRSNEKNDIEFKRETQLNNKNLIYDGFNIEYSGFDIPKRIKESLNSKVPSNLSSDEMIKIFLNNHKNLPTDRLEFEKYILNIFKNDPEQTAFLLKLYSKLAKSLKFSTNDDLFNELLSSYAKV